MSECRPELTSNRGAGYGKCAEHSRSVWECLAELDATTRLELQELRLYPEKLEAAEARAREAEVALDAAGIFRELPAENEAVTRKPTWLEEEARKTCLAVHKALDILDIEADAENPHEANMRCDVCPEIIAFGRRAMAMSMLPLQTIVDAQAEDWGLWFDAKTAPEAYLQQELRKLHAAIEKELRR